MEGAEILYDNKTARGEGRGCGDENVRLVV